MRGIQGKLRWGKLCMLATACMMACTAKAQEQVTSKFNAANVILPSSQYTPGQPYEAWVWVYNKGERYSDSMYNIIQGAPDKDAEGRQWYEPDYALTDNGTAWKKARSPFSSDEYYKEQKSCQWVTADIMGEMYMRRSFVLNSAIESTVYLSTGHDDAPSEWYINGTRVHAVTDGWNNDEYILLSDEQKALLKTDGSENVIAVHVHQNWGGAFADCGLYAADMTTERAILPTVTDSGAWDCLYYMLNYNADLAKAEAGKWYAMDEDESDWAEGKGPFSNDENMFMVSEWGSQVRPILIRRHFTLTEDDLKEMGMGSVKLLCSYDEDPTVYLNGMKIWSATGWNDNNYAEQTLTAQAKSRLRVGDNVLAVSLKQGSGGGHIDYGLRLVRPYTPTAIEATGAADPQQGRDTWTYDMGGRLMGTEANQAARGIYITHGKKTIVK